MSPSSRRRWWVVIVALCVALLSVAVIDKNTSPDDNADREFGLAAQFACPVCGGQSIAESDVPIAREIRKEIRIRLDQGQTDDQIRQYLVGLYGENIDLKPKASGVTGLVWAIPVFVFVLALAGLVAVFRRWRNEATVLATDDDRAMVAAARARAQNRVIGEDPTEADNE
jgi:cytochrome c-type biogenesis protein CcmH